MNTILAVGADMKNRFLLAKGRKLAFGPEIGDLSDAQNYERFKKEISRILKNAKPNIIAYDMHPNYFSTRFVTSAGTGLFGGDRFFYEKIFTLKNLSPHEGQDLSPYVSRVTSHELKPIQHHEAHVASVMYEHNLKKPVIGVSFDGTGYGTDGNIWGGEFFLAADNKFKRLAHFKYMKMPGGERAIHEPWRMVLGIMGKKGAPFIKGVSEKDKKAVLMLCEKEINTPLTSSAGRIFDAASALLSICVKASYEAEGPIKLETMCEDGIKESYEFIISKSDNKYIIDIEKLFCGMVSDLKKGERKSFIATKFHNSIAKIIVKTLEKLSKQTRVRDVALSGGVFQNRFLKIKTTDMLISSGFKVFTNEKTPVNDFNISLGQYYVSSGARKD